MVLMPQIEVPRRKAVSHILPVAHHFTFANYEHSEDSSDEDVEKDSLALHRFRDASSRLVNMQKLIHGAVRLESPKELKSRLRGVQGGEHQEFMTYVLSNHHIMYKSGQCLSGIQEQFSNNISLGKVSSWMVQSLHEFKMRIAQVVWCDILQPLHKRYADLTSKVSAEQSHFKEVRKTYLQDVSMLRDQLQKRGDVSDQVDLTYFFRETDTLLPEERDFFLNLLKECGANLQSQLGQAKEHAKRCCLQVESLTVEREEMNTRLKNELTENQVLQDQVETLQEQLRNSPSPEFPRNCDVFKAFEEDAQELLDEQSTRCGTEDSEAALALICECGALLIDNEENCLTCGQAVEFAQPYRPGITKLTEKQTELTEDLKEIIAVRDVVDSMEEGQCVPAAVLEFLDRFDRTSDHVGNSPISSSALDKNRSKIPLLSKLSERLHEMSKGERVMTKAEKRELLEDVAQELNQKQREIDVVETMLRVENCMEAQKESQRLQQQSARKCGCSCFQDLQALRRSHNQMRAVCSEASDQLYSITREAAKQSFALRSVQKSLDVAMNFFNSAAKMQSASAREQHTKTGMSVLREARHDCVFFRREDWDKCRVDSKRPPLAESQSVPDRIEDVDDCDGHATAEEAVTPLNVEKHSAHHLSTATVSGQDNQRKGVPLPPLEPIPFFQGSVSAERQDGQCAKHISPKSAPTPGHVPRRARRFSTQQLASSRQECSVAHEFHPFLQRSISAERQDEHLASSASSKSGTTTGSVSRTQVLTSRQDCQNGFKSADPLGTEFHSVPQRSKPSERQDGQPGKRISHTAQTTPGCVSHRGRNFNSRTTIAKPDSQQRFNSVDPQEPELHPMLLGSTHEGKLTKQISPTSQTSTATPDSQEGDSSADSQELEIPPSPHRRILVGPRNGALPEPVANFLARVNRDKAENDAAVAQNGEPCTINFGRNASSQDDHREGYSSAPLEVTASAAQDTNFAQHAKPFSIGGAIPRFQHHNIKDTCGQDSVPGGAQVKKRHSISACHRQSQSLPPPPSFGQEYAHNSLEIMSPSRAGTSSGNRLCVRSSQRSAAVTNAAAAPKEHQDSRRHSTPRPGFGSVRWYRTSNEVDLPPMESVVTAQQGTLL